MDSPALNNLSYRIIQAAIEIHKAIGPGLLESAYRRCMIYELGARSLAVRSEVTVPIRYKELVLEGCYRLDLLVEDAIIIELKSVDSSFPSIVPRCCLICVSTTSASAC